MGNPLRVRVAYRLGDPIPGRDLVPLRGWGYDVYRADNGQWLGGGWSAGRKRDAEQDFARQCLDKGWIL